MCIGPLGLDRGHSLKDCRSNDNLAHLERILT
jgi:hypothetical protein